MLSARKAGPADWQVNVVRFLSSANDLYTWAYDDTMSSVGSAQYWPHLAGIEISAAAARPPPHADVYGLGIGGRGPWRVQNGIGNFEQMKPRPYGVDVTYPVTNTLALVGTLNPDFSNVEQDQTTIAPQEFQRQYNEYRPFFAQGANYINTLPGTNINSADIPFYSPRIGVFNSGVKLEGTQGLNSIGILNVTGDGFNDSAFGYNYSRPNQSFGASVTGVDANHDGIRDELIGFGVGITNPRDGIFIGSKITSDFGTEVSSERQARDFQLSTGIQNSKLLVLVKYADIGPQYNPLDGYITENDIRGPQAFFQYTGTGNKGSLISHTPWRCGSLRLIEAARRILNRFLQQHEPSPSQDPITLEHGQSRRANCGFTRIVTPAGVACCSTHQLWHW